MSQNKGAGALQGQYSRAQTVALGEGNNPERGRKLEDERQKNLNTSQPRGSVALVQYRRRSVALVSSVSLVCVAVVQ